jgi:hypothetical protein
MTQVTATLINDLHTIRTDPTIRANFDAYMKHQYEVSKAVDDFNQLSLSEYEEKIEMLLKNAGVFILIVEQFGTAFSDYAEV